MALTIITVCYKLYKRTFSSTYGQSVAQGSSQNIKSLLLSLKDAVHNSLQSSFHRCFTGLHISKIASKYYFRCKWPLKLTEITFLRILIRFQLKNNITNFDKTVQS